MLASRSEEINLELTYVEDGGGGGMVSLGGADVGVSGGGVLVGGGGGGGGWDDEKGCCGGRWEEEELEYVSSLRKWSAVELAYPLCRGGTTLELLLTTPICFPADIGVSVRDGWSCRTGTSRNCLNEHNQLRITVTWNQHTQQSER